MKKLDKLILKSFFGPFVITFFIAVFVLMMQILWKYIDDLVGKGLDFGTIGKFVWYASASLLTLSMPIAILISSIMTFGNLGERFELVAIKSAGISLLRFMRPLAIVTLFLCGITFVFANWVIPYSELKFYTMYNDIFFKKPAFDLKEGTFFTHIPDYAIRVGKKEPDNRTIHKILIYENNNSLQYNTITAHSGFMSISPNKNFLEFNLKEGYRYQENGTVNDTATEFVRLKFREFKKLFDLSALQKSSTPDSVFKDNQKMMSTRQLNERMDRLSRQNDSTDRTHIQRYNFYLRYHNLPDSIWEMAAKNPINNFEIPDSAKKLIANRLGSAADDMVSVSTTLSEDQDRRRRSLRNTKLEWHKKFAFSLACLVLFFIGAPLGSIIRKGGLGLPLIVSILLFLVFHLLNTFGEKFVKDDSLPPYIGMWLATMVLAPIGIFITYKAMTDSQLLNAEAYRKLLNGIKKVFGKKQELPK